MTTDEPMSQMVQEAVTMHVMFLNFLAGGFTEDQAIKLVAALCVANNKDEGGETL